MGYLKPLSPSISLWLAATGGSTVLAAVDTLLPPPVGVVVDSELVARRAYDYGPCLRFGGVLELLKNGRALSTLTYQGYQINVVDGQRSFHVLQRMQLDVRLPLSGPIALGAGAEYFFRKAYFWPLGNRKDESPQFKLFLSWSHQ